MAKQISYHIFSRKELNLLTAFLFLLCLICFTYGVHVSKSSPVSAEEHRHEEPHHSHLAETVKEELPSEKEILENESHVTKEAQDAASKTLEKEVMENQIKLQKAIELELPK